MCYKKTITIKRIQALLAPLGGAFFIGRWVVLLPSFLPHPPAVLLGRPDASGDARFDSSGRLMDIIDDIGNPINAGWPEEQEILPVEEPEPYEEDPFELAA